jgi:integrase
MGKPPSAFEVSPARVRVKRGPRADGRWYWRADRPDGHGGRIDVWTGWGTKEEAAEAIRAKLGEVEPEPEAVEEIVTVGDLLDCWLGAIRLERTDERDRTRMAIEGAVLRLVASDLRRARVQTVARAELVEHVNAALGDGYGGATIARDLKYLRQAWRWGQELIPPQVPLRRLPSVRIEAKPVYTRFTPEASEVGGLLERVPPAVRRAVVLLAATGARIGEVLGLTWDRVGLDGSWLIVDGKTGERRVEVHPVIADELRRWGRGEPGELVVGVSGNTVRKHLARRSEQLKLGRVSPNSLRRHVVDALYEAAGADPKAAGSQVGHSAQTALTNYRQVRSKQRRAVVESAELGVVVAFERPGDRSEEVG